jgi:RNA polymerase sigma-70 factor (ECF subfamily)
MENKATSPHADSTWNSLAENILPLQKQAFHLAFRVTGNRAVAEEAVQEAYLSAMQRVRTNPPKLLHPPDWVGWFFGVVINTAKLKVRGEVNRRHREERIALKRETVMVSPDQTDALRSDLREALQQLSEPLRLPLVLHYEMGLSPAEVSRMLNLSERAVYVRMNKGLAQLRRSLSATGYAPAPAAVVKLLSAGILENPSAALAADIQAMCAQIQAGTLFSESVHAGTMGFSMTSPVKATVVALALGVVIGTSTYFGGFWQKMDDTSAATQTEKKTSTTVMPTDKHLLARWTFNQGLAKDLQPLGGIWQWVPVGDGLPAGMSVGEEPVFVILPLKIPDVPFFVELKYSGNINLNDLRQEVKNYEKHAGTRITTSGVQWCDDQKTFVRRAWNRSFLMPAKSNMIRRYYFYGRYCLSSRDQEWVGLYEWEQERLANQISVGLRNLILEEIVVRSMSEEDLPRELREPEKTKVKFGGRPETIPAAMFPQ